MKIFYINGGICHYDMTALYASAEEARQFYPPSDVIVEAPDYVRENWGYDDTAEGNERFVKPTPLEGWLYDDDTGTMYPDPDWEPSEIEPPIVDPSIEMIKEQLQNTEEALALLGIIPEEVAD